MGLGALSCSRVVLAERQFFVDLRLVNQLTHRHQFSMPFIEQELSKLANLGAYPDFDFIHSYRQLALHQESHESRSIINPFGVCSLTREPNGTTIAEKRLQISLTLTLSEALKSNLLLWLNDFQIRRCLSGSSDSNYFSITALSTNRSSIGPSVFFTPRWFVSVAKISHTMVYDKTPRGLIPSRN